MKKHPFLSSTACKVVVFILTVLFLTLTAASAAACALMIGSGVYFNDKSVFLTEQLGDQAYSEAYTMLSILLHNQNSPGVASQITGRLARSEADALAVYDADDGELLWLYSEADSTFDPTAMPGSKQPDSNAAVRFEPALADGILRYNEHADGSLDAGVCFPVSVWRQSDGDIILINGYETEADQRLAVCLALTIPEGLAGPFSAVRLLTDAAYQMKTLVWAVFAVSLALSAAGSVFLMCASGRHRGKEAVEPGWATRLPFDLVTAGLVTAGVALAALADELSGPNDISFFLWLILLFPAAAAFFLGWCMSAALRIKLGKWWENTIIWKIFCLIFRLVQKLVRLCGRLPLIWKTAVSLAGLVVVELIALVCNINEGDNLFFLWLFERMLLVPFVLWCAFQMKRLWEGGQALAGGRLDRRIDTRYLFGDFRTHAEALNRVSDGVGIAVEERLKSERMKTELVTNVSHDLKTPLTSVINYADLIAKEPCENEKITEYAAVLTRQSTRLKRLIDDLVEASKAASGALEIKCEPCSVGVLLSQALGEYEQRFIDAGLSIMTKQPGPERELTISADGRRLWRVFDNLMNNIVKYAQPGTRVWLTLEEESSRAVLTFRNVSREPIDTEHDLTERFVRGDESRSTDGSGLGLSIARSLVERMAGTFELTVDGDLFKVRLTFPLSGN